jgi:hypothetical protein
MYSIDSRYTSSFSRSKIGSVMIAPFEYEYRSAEYEYEDSMARTTGIRLWRGPSRRHLHFVTQPLRAVTLDFDPRTI